MRHTILTYTGQAVQLDDPQVESIRIEDIAHALSQINRYTGHTKTPYSVAQHSLLMSCLDICDPLVALLHDAAEAYIGDVATPLKLMLSAAGITFSELEAKHLAVIGKQLNVPGLATAVQEEPLKIADKVMLVAEGCVLLDAENSLPWSYVFEWAKTSAMAEQIEEAKIMVLIAREISLPPTAWEKMFLAKYKELMNARAANR